MQIDTLFVEDFVLSDDAVVTARAVRCDFERPTYVGVRGIIEDTRHEVMRFPSRTLTLDSRRRDAFDVVESWTMPPWTLYVVVPPREFTADIRFTDTADPLRARPASDGQSLYYYSLLQGSGDRVPFHVAAHFERNPGDYRRTIERSGRVHERTWSGVWEAVARPLSNATEQVANVATVIDLLIRTSAGPL